MNKLIIYSVATSVGYRKKQNETRRILTKGPIGHRPKGEKISF